jgi:syntaxin 1B/2/3
VQLTKGIEHARRARKMKWWCFGIVVIILVIIAIVLGVIFGTGVVGTGAGGNN